LLDGLDTHCFELSRELSPHAPDLAYWNGFEGRSQRRIAQAREVADTRCTGYSCPPSSIVDTIEVAIKRGRVIQLVY